MTDKAKQWFNQELEMVRNRVKLHLKQDAPSGNPMTAKQGIQHLHGVKSWIKKYPELYA